MRRVPSRAAAALSLPPDNLLVSRLFDEDEDNEATTVDDESMRGGNRTSVDRDLPWGSEVIPLVDKGAGAKEELDVIGHFT